MFLDLCSGRPRGVVRCGGGRETRSDVSQEVQGKYYLLGCGQAKDNGTPLPLRR